METVKVGISMGCPVGVGPEITVRLLAKALPDAFVQPFVLGDVAVLKRCAGFLGITKQVVEWQPGEPYRKDRIQVMSLSDLPPDLEWGRPDKGTGLAMAKYIETGVQLIGEGKLDAIATCPITKSTLRAAGYDFPGHTEMLAWLCKTDTYAMMLAGSKLKVTLVTIHIPFAGVPANLTRDRIIELIAITDSALRRDFGLADPRIAVAGLNPHAGEGGLFGNEEAMIIEPAVKQARQEDWNVDGPFPPDTVFYKAAKGDHDAVVCMYHDQGLIPFKLLHFEDGVNVTLGLPLVRTSVDHGTAYDIAGKGIASPASLESAVLMAAEIVRNRNRNFETENWKQA